MYLSVKIEVNQVNSAFDLKCCSEWNCDCDCKILHFAEFEFQYWTIIPYVQMCSMMCSLHDVSSISTDLSFSTNLISPPTSFLFLTHVVFMLPTPCYSLFLSSPDTQAFTSVTFASVLLYTPRPACLAIFFFFLLSTVFVNSSEVSAGLSAVCLFLRWRDRERRWASSPPPLFSPLMQQQEKLTHRCCCCLQRLLPWKVSPSAPLLCTFTLSTAGRSRPAFYFLKP